MSRDRVIGFSLIAVSVLVVFFYIYALFTEYALIVLKLTAAVAVAGVFGILAWIGYTLATTPPPKPVEEIEKEIEQELKKLDAEEKTSS
ncbi:MAG: transcriptional regulator [Fervidicoccaceae archaeon]